MFWCFTWSPLTIARLHCRSVVLFSFLLLSSDQSPSFLLGLLVYHPGRVLRFLVITWSLHLAFACKGEGAATVFFCSSRTSIWSIMLLSTKFLSCQASPFLLLCLLESRLFVQAVFFLFCLKPLPASSAPNWAFMKGKKKPPGNPLQCWFLYPEVLSCSAFQSPFFRVVMCIYNDYYWGCKLNIHQLHLPGSRSLHPKSSKVLRCDTSFHLVVDIF